MSQKALYKPDYSLKALYRFNVRERLCARRYI